MDIIQQHLCCPQTVALIEKCTCLHVHCAHHLCEESMMTFDAKINNENMTKCLQSLKEMEVQQFRDEVRNSAEAKFAVQVFSALNSNNFVRFFKLSDGFSTKF
ncbi:hypothetical protein CRUP_037793 [Coryphaenoides rupestris]|nr:hypothetical protein CRUP_037793 [Coryphaenoides rupestris]